MVKIAVELGPRDAVLIVDVQNDFFPGGALPVKEGENVVPALNRWIEAAQAGGATVVASRDWHPRGHASFQKSGGPWPAHCVQETPGAAFCPDLVLPVDAVIVSKGDDPKRDAYSAFEGTDLALQLRARGITRLWIGGVATEYCVLSTVLDAVKNGFEVHVLEEALAAVEAKARDGARALGKMRDAGAVIEA